jgi:hypothetical protein
VDNSTSLPVHATDTKRNKRTTRGELCVASTAAQECAW